MQGKAIRRDIYGGFHHFNARICEEKFYLWKLSAPEMVPCIAKFAICYSGLLLLLSNKYPGICYSKREYEKETSAEVL